MSANDAIRAGIERIRELECELTHVRAERDALIAERTSLIATKREQLGALTAERDIWRGLALRGVE